MQQNKPVLDDTYQKGYSERFAQYLFDSRLQAEKAGKALAVFREYLGSEQMSRSKLLDIGCSVGLITARYSDEFAEVLGIDIDDAAVKYANKNFAKVGLEFQVADAMATGLPPESVDAVACAHIYEHVPDSKRLVAEIYRVLRPGGVCFFAAQNRITLMEPHYLLPGLSMLPKPLANIYYRVMGKGNFYYEKLLTLPSLRKLVRQFDILDYTVQIVADPEKYDATEMLTPGSLGQKAALFVLRFAYFLCPTYIWLLKKPVK